MTNFDFLTSDPQFNTFAPVAVSAEKILHIDTSASILNCRRCMEFAVKWMYSVDGERPGVKFCVSVFRQKSRMALGSRADSGLNPLITESHGGQNGMRAGTA